MLVKLEIFEDYRERLTKYALGLLRVHKQSKNFTVEDEKNAQDIVQNAYLAFHKKGLDVDFQNDFHIFSFLKNCLYNCYMQFICDNDYQAFTFLSHNNFDIIKDKEEVDYYNVEEELEDFDFTEHQLKIVKMKLEGNSNILIANALGLNESNVSRVVAVAKKKLNGIAKTVGGGKKILKPIIKCDILGAELEEYPSIKEAAEANSLHSSAICRCLKGNTFSCGKFKWKYKENGK